MPRYASHHQDYINRECLHFIYQIPKHTMSLKYTTTWESNPQSMLPEILRTTCCWMKWNKARKSTRSGGNHRYIRWTPCKTKIEEEKKDNEVSIVIHPRSLGRTWQKQRLTHISKSHDHRSLSFAIRVSSGTEITTTRVALDFLVIVIPLECSRPRWGRGGHAIHLL